MNHGSRWKFALRLAAQTTLMTGVVLGTMAAPAAAQGLFRNGENASLVLGQKNFTSGAAATTRRGENSPDAVVFDSSGNLWVDDQCNSRVLEFMPPFDNDMKAALVIGEPDFTTTSSPQACFSGTINPTNLPNILSYNASFAFDGAGNLWVADGGNNRVLEFKPPFSNGMNPSLVLGQPNFTSSAAATTQNGMSFPATLVFDAAGDVFVSDDDNSRALEFKPPFSNGMNASVVIGEQDFESAVCDTTANTVCYPNGIAMDSTGNLWLGDDDNNRVLEYAPPFSTGMNASRVIGQKNFVSNGAGIGRSGLNFVNSGSGLVFDADGNLWVGDLNNNRVLEFPSVNGVVGKHASTVIGQSNFQGSAPATTRNGTWFPVQSGFDAQGNLWVPDAVNNRVLEYPARH